MLNDIVFSYLLAVDCCNNIDAYSYITVHTRKID